MVPPYTADVVTLGAKFLTYLYTDGFSILYTHPPNRNSIFLREPVSALSALYLQTRLHAVNRGP